MDDIKESINNVVVWPVHDTAYAAVDCTVSGSNHIIVDTSVSGVVHGAVDEPISLLLSFNIKTIIDQVTKAG